jgi:hypothetical protein
MASSLQVKKTKKKKQSQNIEQLDKTRQDTLLTK